MLIYGVEILRYFIMERQLTHVAYYRILNTDVVRFYRVVHSLEGDVSRTVDLAFSTTGKVYAFRDMVLNCAGIAYYLESHVSIIDRRLKGLSREDAEAVLREMDKHAHRS